MKKIVAVMMTVMVLASATSAFASETYYTDKSVSSDDAQGMKTVLITNDSTNEIVYVNQESGGSVFSASTKFLLKESVSEGSYTIKLGGGDAAVTKEFYIGLSQLMGDVEMKAVSDVSEVDGGYAIGYTAENITTDYKTLLVKKTDGTVIGCEIDTKLTGDANVVYGVQINAESKEDLESIANVYISTRAITISDDTAEVN